MISKLWDMQEKYNNRVKDLEKTREPDYWTQVYLLGMVSEFDEILDAIRWKRHRRNDPGGVPNLGYELADLTKYVISLWQLWGYTVEDMLRYCIQKSEVLDRLLDQEFSEIPEGVPVLITDIDGTMGDWRSTFMDWSYARGVNPMIDDPATSLILDADLNMRYPDYYAMKEQFESEGGYRFVKPYTDVIETVREAQDRGYYLIVATARPADRYKRIWMDTWDWLIELGIVPDKLLMQSDSRVLLADSIMRTNRVIMFDDDPGLILRAANSGIQVYGRSTPYNEGIRHENVKILTEFSQDILE